MSGSNKAILDLLYSTVDKQLSSPASEKAMFQVIGKFIDKNVDLLQLCQGKMVTTRLP